MELSHTNKISRSQPYRASTTQSHPLIPLNHIITSCYRACKGSPYRIMDGRQLIHCYASDELGSVNLQMRDTTVPKAISQYRSCPAQDKRRGAIGMMYKRSQLGYGDFVTTTLRPECRGSLARTRICREPRCLALRILAHSQDSYIYTYDVSLASIVGGDSRRTCCSIATDRRISMELKIINTSITSSRARICARMFISMMAQLGSNLELVQTKLSIRTKGSVQLHMYRELNLDEYLSSTK